MNRKCFKICLLSVVALVFSLNAGDVKAQLSEALPPIIVYKTTKDYSKNVAVTLSEDKKRIVAYPAPTDVSERSYPTALQKGYWLDNRGISPNTAFLSITYEEYAKLKKTPSLDELYKMIVATDPIKKMYLCGRGTTHDGIISEMNALIKKHFKGCKRIK